MKLIVGLGNPGREYDNTRHNSGFMTIDALAKELNVTFKFDKKFNGEIAEYGLGDNKVVLLKPFTYMNASGQSVAKVMKFYKINSEDIIVINDDLDMAVGKIRFRAKGSSGGHNGLKSIVACIGTQEFKRLKVGIGRDKFIPVVDYVLGKFSGNEKTLFDSAKDIAVMALKDYIHGETYLKISSKYN